MRFKLRFPIADVTAWAAKYSYSFTDQIPRNVARAARRRGRLTSREFLALAKWKSPRTQPRCAENSAAFIAEVTKTALAAKDEQLRIEVLTLLRGVHWPTASVILHYCARGRYPILDYRALWSLSSRVPKHGYNFPFWWAYCQFTRRLADSGGVSMRVLDRALWRYSKELQPPGA